ncbi:2-oxoglutarate synthase subunit alpha, partial [Candidatus Bathyarchaeota archaeon ex4484_135]
MPKSYLWQGNVACVEGAIAAGCRFFAGYPITPANEISEHMAKRMPEVGGIFIQMEDEMASLAAVIGAS